MERHKALTAAAIATMLAATGTVALAATGHTGLLGFGEPFSLQRASAPVAPAASSFDTVPPTTAATQVVTQLQDVYDRFVVTVPGPSAPAGAPTGQPANNDDATTSNIAPVMPPPTTKPPTTKPPKTNEPPPSTTTSTTTPPPTTTRPHEDDDWHSSQPPPPIPPGCKDPQLEDNGVWNCQH